MTYEQLIVTIDNEAPFLSNTAYKLLWRLIALAICSGSTVVQISQRRVASDLRRSKEAIATATDELAKVIPVSRPGGLITTYSLPPEWFPPQRTLFTDDQLRPDIHSWPGNQATTGLETRPPLGGKPGHYWAENQATWAENQATTGRKTRPPRAENQATWAENQATSHDGTGEDTRARVDRSIDSDLAQQDLLVRVDRAVQTVEILPALQQDAEILRDTLVAYRDSFPGTTRLSDIPDDVVIAHCLALADLEELHRVLRTLAEHRVKPQPSDMWFFFTLADKTIGAPSKLVHERMKLAKGKNRSNNQTPLLFAPQLVKQVAAGGRRLG